MADARRILEGFAAVLNRDPAAVDPVQVGRVWVVRLMDGLALCKVARDASGRWVATVESAPGAGA
jgi:hypothetical protein